VGFSSITLGLILWDFRITAENPRIIHMEFPIPVPPFPKGLVRVILRPESEKVKTGTEKAWCVSDMLALAIGGSYPAI
jgi:hypothetical protein